jgi:hypothetical protein
MCQSLFIEILPSCPDTLANKIKAAFDEGADVLVTVLKAVGEETIIDTKGGQ